MPFLRNAPAHDLFEAPEKLGIFCANAQAAYRQKHILPRYIRPVHLFVGFTLTLTTYLQVVNNSSLSGQRGVTTFTSK